MTHHLYKMTSSNGEFHCDKFDEDLTPLTSYVVSKNSCECCANNLSTCRHRVMLMIWPNERLNSSWFYDFDYRRWITSSLLLALAESIEPALELL